MNDRKIIIITHAADKKEFALLDQSLQQLVVPEGFELEIQRLVPGKGWLYGALNLAMRADDAKYKIYLNGRAVITERNFLVELIKIFSADEKIGAVGVSGAIELSTHGIAFTSARRGGKIFSGEKAPQPNDWKNSGEAQVLDSFFIATQYDLPWRTDFEDDTFGGQAHCMEFRRAGYKLFIPETEVPWLWYRNEAGTFDEPSLQKFLDEYSADLFPLVTVLIPTFNRPEYFREALNSVLGQTYRNLEVIISDDSTNDETEELIQEYSDPRIKYFRNRGFTAEENWGFLRAYNNPAAEYINWLMDDDLFHPTKIAKMIEVYRTNPDVSLVTSERNVIDDNGEITKTTGNPFAHDVKIPGEEAGKWIFFRDNFIGELTSVLIRKKFLRGGDLFWHEDEQRNFGLPDVSTWLQLLSKGYFVQFSECLSSFRWHSGQQQQASDVRALAFTSWIKLFKAAWDEKIFIQYEHEYRSAAMRFIMDYSRLLGGLYLENNRTKEVDALENILFALVHSIENGCKLSLPPAGIFEEAKT